MKIRNAFAIACILLAAGCTDKEKQAETTAAGFLEAFLSNEYDKAAEYCSEELKGEFLKATADFNSLEPSIKELMVEECNKYEAEIAGTARINKSDTVEVNYKIYRKADSLSFESGAITGVLQVVEGKVTTLGL